MLYEVITGLEQPEADLVPRVRGEDRSLRDPFAVGGVAVDVGHRVQSYNFV